MSVIDGSLHLVDAARAAQILRRSDRVLVNGCSGGGKSTLATLICRRFGLPFVSMDRDFYWLPGWVKRDRAASRALIEEAVAGERWLMDGTGASSFDLRMPHADLVIWVRMPRWLCLWGVFSRSIRHLGQTRPEMAPGCLERFPDRQFLSFIWNFERKTAPLVVDGIRRFSPECPVLMLRSRGEMRAFVDLLGT